VDGPVSIGSGEGCGRKPAGQPPHAGVDHAIDPVSQAIELVGSFLKSSPTGEVGTPWAVLGWPSGPKRNDIRCLLAL